MSEHAGGTYAPSTASRTRSTPASRTTRFSNHCSVLAKPEHVEHLNVFTAESFGGPDTFTRELGFQHLIDAHRHLHITEAQRNVSSTSTGLRLEQSDMPNDIRFRDAVMSHIEFGTHVAMQNSNADTDGPLYPSATYRSGPGSPSRTHPTTSPPHHLRRGRCV